MGQQSTVPRPALWAEMCQACFGGCALTMQPGIHWQMDYLGMSSTVADGICHIGQ